MNIETTDVTKIRLANSIVSDDNDGRTYLRGVFFNFEKAEANEDGSCNVEIAGTNGHALVATTITVRGDVPEKNMTIRFEKTPPKNCSKIMMANYEGDELLGQYYNMRDKPIKSGLRFGEILKGTFPDYRKRILDNVAGWEERSSIAFEPTLLSRMSDAVAVRERPRPSFNMKLTSEEYGPMPIEIAGIDAEIVLMPCRWGKP